MGYGFTPANDSSNSLPGFISSMANSIGTQGQNAEVQGMGALAPVLSSLTGLSKGDQGDVTQAAQPEIDQISQQFDQIRNMISQQPRGGGKTTALAEAPFQKSAAIQRTEGDMRSKATGQLSSLGMGLAGLGAEQQQQAGSLGATEQEITKNPSIFQDIIAAVNAFI